MSDKRVSQSGKRVSEGDMSTVALNNAIRWHDKLMDAEFKGRKDNESAARFRLSKKIGVPESYLYRLTYKRSGMRDVAGEVYRRLQEGYEAICLKIETSAEAMAIERREYEARNEILEGHKDMAEGMERAPSAPQEGTLK